MNEDYHRGSESVADSIPWPMWALGFVFAVTIFYLTDQSHYYEKHTEQIYFDKAWYNQRELYVNYLEDNQVIIDQVPPKYGVPLKVFVNNTGKSWFKCDYAWNSLSGYEDGGFCEIHIQSLDQINGAGWNHGKQGKGNTQRVQ